MLQSSLCFPGLSFWNRNVSDECHIYLSVYRCIYVCVCIHVFYMEKGQNKMVSMVFTPENFMCRTLILQVSLSVPR